MQLLEIVLLTAVGIDDRLGFQQGQLKRGQLLQKRAVQLLTLGVFAVVLLDLRRQRRELLDKLLQGRLAARGGGAREQALPDDRVVLRQADGVVRGHGHHPPLKLKSLLLRTILGSKLCQAPHKFGFKSLQSSAQFWVGFKSQLIVQPTFSDKMRLSYGIIRYQLAISRAPNEKPSRRASCSVLGPLANSWPRVGTLVHGR